MSFKPFPLCPYKEDKIPYWETEEDLKRCIKEDMTEHSLYLYWVAGYTSEDVRERFFSEVILRR